MVSRYIYLQLIFRIVMLSVSALATGFFFFRDQYILSCLAFALLIGLTVSLIRYVNHTNRKIAYFFDAIKNEDFTLRFPEKLSVKSLEELNHSLNMLNAMIQDIHLKKQAQEQYYQEILKQADIGILTINSKGHILYANPTVQRLLNYSPLNHIKQFNQVDEKLYRLFEELAPFESRIFQLENEREKTQLALKSTSIQIDDQELLLVVVQDIHKELDEKETDSWVKLIRVLTHEIMNTITPITSISESILKYFKTTDTIPQIQLNEDHIQNTVKGLEVIKEQGGDLMEFVQSYRSFLSLPKPDKALVSVQKLLDKVLVLMDQEGQNDAIKFRILVEPADLELYIDEKQISQILINLIKNAQQSMNGDKMTLPAEREYFISITIGISETNGKKYIQITDNGPGIPPELIDEIFVPFFTTKNTGTGIGLSLSKQIMHLHGGTIRVHSVPYQETSFILVF
ncbi:histidine kinase [Aggregatimonas sangjinii]|uniref:histidine kinase n=1 Tax=Aggregatimonas sangjinii TaxID=2583587 RepID=A0A5B7SP70_9FLAO|nr:ATP-binding protein [Aggregatimonas sangjinii]QCW98810.1 histidine kinase [Aggregatimonas sangjinii]